MKLSAISRPPRTIRSRLCPPPAKPSGKDFWDKVSTLTVPFATLVVGLVGSYATYSFNQTDLTKKSMEATAARLQQDQQVAADRLLRARQEKDADDLSRAQALEKFYPFVTSDDPRKRTFGYAMFAALGQGVLAAKLIDINHDKAGIPVLQKLSMESNQAVSSAAKSTLATFGTRGTELIERFVGFFSKPYKDSAGRYLIGVDHWITPDESKSGIIAIGKEKIKFADGITKNQAETLLRQDIKPALDCVKRNVTIDLNADQADALASFVYNVGCSNFDRSFLLREINARQFDAVSAEFVKWSKTAGADNPGLMRRRLAEAELFGRPQ